MLHFDVALRIPHYWSFLRGHHASSQLEKLQLKSDMGRILIIKVLFGYSKCQLLYVILLVTFTTMQLHSFLFNHSSHLKD